MRETFISPSEMVTMIPIQIRPGLIVKIVGLPADLTQSEAKKIASVVIAHART